MAMIEEIENMEMELVGGDAIRSSPEGKSTLVEEDSDEEDETIVERLIGLTEMFPERLRTLSCSTACLIKRCTLGFFGASCSLTWVIFSSSAILFAPLLFEIERAQLQEMQRKNQRQVLFGPNSQMTDSNIPVGPPLPQ